MCGTVDSNKYCQIIFRTCSTQIFRNDLIIKSLIIPAYATLDGARNILKCRFLSLRYWKYIFFYLENIIGAQFVNSTSINQVIRRDRIFRLQGSIYQFCSDIDDRFNNFNVKKLPSEQKRIQVKGEKSLCSMIRSSVKRKCLEMKGK